MIDVDDLIQRFRALPIEKQRIVDAAVTPEVGQIMLEAWPELEPMLLPLIAGDGEEETSAAPPGVQPAPMGPQPPAGDMAAPAAAFGRMVR